jgi:hypothetical protein
VCVCQRSVVGGANGAPARVICERVACKNAIRHSEAAGQKAKAERERERDQSASHPQSVGSAAFCIIREAGWLAGSSWREAEGCMVARRPLAHSVPLLLHTRTDSTLTTRPTQLSRIILLVLISHSLMRNGAKHVPLGVLGRQLDAPRRNKCVSPTQSSVRRTGHFRGRVQCTSGAAPAFRQPTCVPINSAPTRRQCRTYCSAKLTRRRREN